MKKIYKLLLMSACSFFGLQAHAQQISVEEAQAKALSFLNGQAEAKTRRVKSNLSSLELAYTAKNGSDKLFYVFNSNSEEGGFVIVGGDKVAQEILGYCTTGTFDYAQAPENMKWWLSQYSEQIHNAINDVKAGRLTFASTSERAKARRKAAGRVTIPELIKTKWNQSKPFNNAIPKYGNNEMVTGCVATAMAQVLKYYNYPTKGSGSYSYNSKNFPLTFSADFGNTTYDWGNMLDTYKSGSYSETEGNAVATLLYHCGVSVEMNYKNGSSGASSSNIPSAISTYFGYDKSAQRVERNYYTDEEWTDLVYNELASNRPVLYGGQDAYGGGGHEFVCHGYDASNNKFAINWGWGGYCDGYFTLIGVDGLQPEGNGIGGAGNGASYSSEQDIIINVMPNKGGKEPLVIVCITDYWGEPKLKDVNSNVTNSATLDLSQSNQTVKYEFYPWNRSNSTKSIETAVMLKDVVSGACLYTNHVSQSRSLNVGGLYQQTINITSSDIPFNGTYEVYPVVRETGTTEWQRLRMPTSVAVPTITAIGGTNPTKSDITFEISGTTVEERGTLTITHDKFYDGNITYTATPSGIVSIDDNGVVTGLKAGNVKITAKGEASTYYNETSKDFNITVTPYVKKNVVFSISDTNVMVGNKLTISHEAPDYAGTIIYTSSNNNIATVSADGIVTGVSTGKVTITAQATEDDLYVQTSKSFDIIVMNPGIALLDYNLPNNGYVTMNSFNFTAKVKNNTSTRWGTTYLKCKIPFDSSQIINVYSEPFKFYSGEEALVTFDIYNSYGNYFPYFFEIGDKITTHIEDYDGNVISDELTFEFCNELSIDYTMSAANWGTICLPFEAEVPAGLTAYNVTSINGKYIVKEEVEKLEMNTPYLLSGDEGTYKFEGPDTPVGSNYKNGILVGNTAPSAEGSYVYAPKDSYVLQNNDGKLGFYKVAEDNTQKVRQYSAYIAAPSNGNSYATSLMLGDDDEATEIETIQEIANDAPAYNLNGVRVNKNAKGFVIVNGKLIYKK